LELLLHDIYKKSRDNWDKVPVEIRNLCLDALRAEISPETLAAWKMLHRSGEQFVGHFSNGMGVRNILRRHVPDRELPPVIYPRGFHSTNWDDYYLGALQELVEKD
jgi:hypothetical protein